MNDTCDALRRMLRRETNALYPCPRPPALQRAGARLDALASAAPALLCMLAEPWREAVAGQETAAEILRCCALVHLYARILDDAVDENLPCHRLALLRAQPLYWRAVSRLGRLSSLPPDEGERLVRETVEAVLTDDDAPAPEYWGRKNHHLLLVPLLLSNDAAAFAAAKEPLSDALCLLQAADELDQAATADADVFARLTLETQRRDVIPRLAELGWKSLAWHLCAVVRDMLRRL